jgi:D-glycero-D-manno-heptose 1,7-bisphosphate phosphatase
MRKALFLDRDGVINVRPAEHDYVKSWSEFEFIAGIERVIRQANEKGILVIVITNQRGIARGLMTERDLLDIHEKMKAALKKKGAVIDAIYYCPHNEGECDCRKPKPGMIWKAAKEFDIDITKSVYVDDMDIAAGVNAACGYSLKFDEIGRLGKELGVIYK